MWVGGWVITITIIHNFRTAKVFRIKCSQMMAKIVNDGENVGSKFTCRC